MSSEDRGKRQRGGRPPKYLFGPDSELTEDERRRKESILKRRERQNEYYQRKKRAKASADEAQSASDHVGSSSASTPDRTSTTGNAIVDKSKGAIDSQERVEEDAVVSEILDEMGEKPPGTSERELKFESEVHRNRYGGRHTP